MRRNSATTWAFGTTPSRHLRCDSRSTSSAPATARMVKPSASPFSLVTCSSGPTTSAGNPEGKRAIFSNFSRRICSAPGWLGLTSWKIFTARSRHRYTRASPPTPSRSLSPRRARSRPMSTFMTRRPRGE